MSRSSIQVSSALRLFLASVGVVLIASFLTSRIQSSWGQVHVQSVTIPTQNGQWVVADWFKPRSATAENPAPFVAVVPGFQRSKEALSNIAIELARNLDGDRCEDVVCMDLSGLSPVTDYFVIGSGTSDRQMRTAAEHAIEYGKKVGEPPFNRSGIDTATWILIDFVHVVVHIFTPEHRTYYDLELLWGDAPRVNWMRSATA